MGIGSVQLPALVHSCRNLRLADATISMWSATLVQQQNKSQEIRAGPFVATSFILHLQNRLVYLHFNGVGVTQYTCYLTVGQTHES